jgi:hypothetical protein
MDMAGLVNRHRRAQAHASSKAAMIYQHPAKRRDKEGASRLSAAGAARPLTELEDKLSDYPVTLSDVYGPVALVARAWCPLHPV